MKAERVFCQLRDLLRVKADALEQVWDRCDEDYDGKINKEQFHKFLRKIGFQITPTELKRLVSYPELKSFALQGGVDFVTMKQKLLKSKYREGDRIILEGTNGRHQGMSTLTFVDAATANKQFVEKLNFDFRSVRKAFMKVDSNKDGKISLFEFQSLFSLLGITIKDEEFEKLTPLYMKYFNRNGLLEFQVVKDKFSTPVGGPRTTVSFLPKLHVRISAEDAIAVLSEHVTRKHKSTTRAFRQVSQLFALRFTPRGQNPAISFLRSRCRAGSQCMPWTGRHQPRRSHF